MFFHLEGKNQRIMKQKESIEGRFCGRTMGKRNDLGGKGKEEGEGRKLRNWKSGRRKKKQGSGGR